VFFARLSKNADGSPICPDENSLLDLKLFKFNCLNIGMAIA